MIIASLVDLFTAGAETTATTIRWFVLYLIHHPQVKQKIVEEIDSVIGNDRAPAYADSVQ
jgi:cytochrome P450 family 2 subfamily U polypeptide 1